MLTPREAARLTKQQPLHRRTESERYEIVRAFEGLEVVLTEDTWRDGSRTNTSVGTVIGITPNPGVGAALIIFRSNAGTLHAFSSARVSTIVPHA